MSRPEDVARLRELWRSERAKSIRGAIGCIALAVILAGGGIGFFLTGGGYILAGLIMLVVSAWLAITATECWENARLATRDLKATEGRTGL